MQTYEEYRYDATFGTSFLDKIGFASAISSELDCIRLALFLPLLLKFFLSCDLKFLQSYEVGVPNTVKDFVNSLLFIVSYIYVCSYSRCTAKVKPFMRSTSGSE